MDAIIDSTVVIHLLRRYEPALQWFDNDHVYGVTAITWMEVMGGASSKANQIYSKETLEKFQLLYVTAADQEWAMAKLEEFQFSHHIGMNDCMIAAVAQRLRKPLYTRTTSKI